MTRIVQVSSEAHIEAVGLLMSEYAASPGIDLAFQGFVSELAALPGDYVPPHGALLLALDASDRAVGCAGLRPFEPPRVAELKRLYVSPLGRGRGLGRDLSVAALAIARQAGYERVRLDTLPSMGSAQRLYEELGVRDIEPYRFNPHGAVRYMELVL